uniref:SYDE2 protein n=1 Tax=Fopius arisanus TaxID=64838 RepID=A0A0C9PZC9_9HYME
MQIAKFFCLLALLGLISAAPAPNPGSVTFPGASTDDFNEDEASSRHLFGWRKKKRRHYPVGLGGHGCRGHGCGGGPGWRPPGYGGYYPQNHPASNSFATASTGSFANHGVPAQANAHSASFNIGPYSATFSIAQAFSGGYRHPGFN